MDPFFFGEPALYGCLHRGSSRQRGAVVCYPFGHEYITMHRAARQLATRISRAGLPTLRFDYSGTGDSSGTLAEARIERWVEEVELAIEELRRRTGVERVSLIGIRLGATLALQAAGRRDDVDALALWDPILRGKDYLRELYRDTRRLRRIAHVRRGPRWRGQVELLGFAVAAELEDDLRRLKLEMPPLPSTERILRLETQGGTGAPLGAEDDAVASRIETQTDALPGLWRWSEDITRVSLPHSQVSSIASWIAHEDR